MYNINVLQNDKAPAFKHEEWSASYRQPGLAAAGDLPSAVPAMLVFLTLIRPGVVGAAPSRVDAAAPVALDGRGTAAATAGGPMLTRRAMGARLDDEARAPYCDDGVGDLPPFAAVPPGVTGLDRVLDSREGGRADALA